MNQEIAHSAAPVQQFSVLLSATRRGAHQARLFSVQQLSDWGLPFDAAAQIVAELAANAATHGHVRGRGFRLTLMWCGASVLRIEVTDARPERLPQLGRPHPREAESGRGLLLVEAYADRWGTYVGPSPCKTVWAELDLTPVTAWARTRSGTRSGTRSDTGSGTGSGARPTGFRVPVIRASAIQPDATPEAKEPGKEPTQPHPSRPGHPHG
ncbi:MULTISPECIES: ATP-binding protein [unclassified Streptomyces]|uniref:ATP-binding protein n=1 Tax=unclassified Streptomyces TaxID=2593676 RepID=UPI002E37B336|nr:ATP-binding protein [Streptomyces sp. NBC_01267]